MRLRRRLCGLPVTDRAIHPAVDLDHFPCGCLITTQDTKIVFANGYLGEALEQDVDALVGQNMDALFTKSARLFCESYITPTVLNEGKCCEVQVTLLHANGASIPRVASVRRMPNGYLAWVFMEAENRNLLFQELESARDALQESREQLELLALTDHLTGLSNRRDFENQGRHILARARRFGRPVSVLMLDVDHFKALNDTHGHDAGDRALCVLADILKSACRQSDVVARLGGDEFACLLGDTGLGAAQLLCARIRIALDMTEGVEFTVSMGIAELAEGSEIDLYDFLKQADDALYAAKRAGRNRTQTLARPELRWGVGG